MAETRLRNIRVGDLWHDAMLVAHEIGTNNSAVCVEALQRLVDDHPAELRRAKRRKRRESTRQ
jgi:hypothetical protein